MPSIPPGVTCPYMTDAGPLTMSIRSRKPVSPALSDGDVMSSTNCEGLAALFDLVAIVICGAIIMRGQRFGVNARHITQGFRDAPRLWVDPPLFGDDVARVLRVLLNGNHSSAERGRRPRLGANHAGRGAGRGKFFGLAFKTGGGGRLASRAAWWRFSGR